ncbi:prohead core scaffold protein and protease [Morganella phage vB_MmoM_MP1]|uniref:Prohead core scaffold protein and protease n=1 Tax=Morganella phage vB_MmoM_MP1 TaxID=1852628 RepID=A0A192YBH1_9CAUD|nr:prohead core scaffold protein and protease [Morganella phage vB_MmoM_MP1]ANM46465.1 prohead core scaffold protein and protease [Morganella phage vB_MmoM_MP1]
MEQLLIENWGLPGECINEVPMVESRQSEEGALYIEGIFLQAEVVNRNNRLYPKKILEKAVDKYIKEQVNSRQALGEFNHPSRAHLDPTQAAILIEKLWWDGNNVRGRARVIEGDYGPGDKLAANIRAGWVPGVSSRGLGSLKASGKGYNVVQEGYRLTVGVDVVWGPSAPDATVTPIRMSESTEINNVEEDKKSADLAFSKLTERLQAL